jgi:hypothetical protein
VNGRSRRSGDLGEALAVALLEQRGWKLVERQARVCGHHIDALMLDPDATEVLVQVKAWQPGGGGQDTVKKDIADAWHLRYCGERRPIMLVLTTPLRWPGLRHMVADALAADLYNAVLIVNTKEMTR